MTQPPYGETPPERWEPGWQPTPYPQQELLPQEIKPGRSRLPLLIGAAAVAVILVGALVAWWLLRDDGEQNRAAYCDAVRTLAPGGNLLGSTSGGTPTPAALSRARDLAPSAVKSEWDDLFALLQGPSAAQIDVLTGVRVLSDLRVIVGDANTKCGMNVQLPF